MNKAQRATANAIHQCIIDVIDRASGDDETIEHIALVCDGLDKVDTSVSDVEALMNDPAIRAAFKKFVAATVGTFQQFESDSNNNDAEWWRSPRSRAKSSAI